MSKEEDSSQKKLTVPKLVKLDNALKLAELWVSKMSKSTEDEPTEVEIEGRPPRLGLGATVPRQSRVGPSNDPVERRLQAKLEIGKRKNAKSAVESAPSSAKDGSDVTDDDEDNLDSRTNAFSKKRAVPLNSSFQANNSKKKKNKK